MPKSSLESSLRRSSKLGREVLERAKRRSVDWSSSRFSKKSNAERKHYETQEDPAVHAGLDHAFTKIVEYMSETTNQCKMFYSSDTRTEPSGPEQTHVCRFHSQKLSRMLGQPQAGAVSTKQGVSEPEDFLIEVSPGTYAITATMQDTGPQTKVVRINAGESTQLTFNL
ncbi:A-kinase-interacting protein 1 isoform X2 [Brachyhypopomus gauderio]|uniref:A-kinase-interacting protein 1 isoform X2 n=1 Tax=Brachyhypopomus gauderio TaxID=698409 RepID=UPI0040419A71